MIAVNYATEELANNRADGIRNGWLAFGVQCLILLVVLFSWDDVVRDLTAFFAKPPAAVYVLVAVSLTAIALVVIHPLVSITLIGLVSVPLFLRNGGPMSVLLWTCLALPATLYSAALTVFFGLGIPTIPTAVALWRTVRWNVKWAPPQVAHTPMPAIATFYATTVVLAMIGALMTWSVTASPVSSF